MLGNFEATFSCLIMSFQNSLLTDRDELYREVIWDELSPLE